MKYAILIIFASVLLFSCSEDKNKSDAFGNFESVEVIVSSETNGKILSLSAKEGDDVKSGEVLGLIDTLQTSLRKDQINASITAINSKTRNISSQIDVLEVQKNNLARDYARIKRLYRDSAATLKQLEDVEGQLNLIDKNIIATKRSLSDANRGLLSEQKPLEKQIYQLNDNLDKSRITSPLSGTILKKYVEAGEIVSFGKPLVKVANLETMILRAYVGGNILSRVKLNDNVKVRIDKGEDEFYEYSGKIEWISGKAEFTPKIVQTKEERTNLVYAVKISVKNDGRIKIGMPGEVKLSDK